MNKLKNIKLENFRNYSKQSFDNLSDFNILVGPNAVGKTNFIEAVQLVTELSSFRHPKAIDLIKEGEEWCRVEASFEDDNAILFVDNKKTYKLNGKHTRYKGKFPSVTFTPDELMMVKGGNSPKRDAVDSLGSQLSKNYYTVRKDYAKALRQKNKLLKDGVNEETLNSINDVMVITGSQLICYRNELIKKIKPLLQSFYKQITGSDEELEITYETSFEVDNFNRDNVRECFKNNIDTEEEIHKKSSLTGPHKDQIRFILNKKNAVDFASQGQQRSIVLAFKLTELQLIENMLNKVPILLLDDVMSELDATRRKMLTKFVLGKTQTFVTTTNLDYFDQELLNKSNIIEIIKN
ncbi:MAG: DNA replication and repair protein RecF [Coriobacteriia bacterium]|nr:DNA replication and repair protein RecF [Coriobacteriia bacterium]